MLSPSLEVIQTLDPLLWNLYRYLPEADAWNPQNLAKFLSTLLPNLSLSMIQNRLEQIQEYRRSLKQLQAMPLIAQRSAEWYALRRNRLTASDTAQAMDLGKFGNRKQLIAKKASTNPDANFNWNVPPLRWGVMYEPIAARTYSQRYGDIEIHEFGLIPHPTLECYGASPDGITELGIMVEFKCPWKRKIVEGEIPLQYELQMIGQMAVCGLRECDYVECDIEEYPSIEEYMEAIESDKTVDHGLVLEYAAPNPANPPSYTYSPPYCTKEAVIAWKETQPTASRTHYWRLRKVHILRLYFDDAKWQEMIPQLQSFWDEVMEARKNDQPTTLTLSDNSENSKKKRYDFIDSEEED